MIDSLIHAYFTGVFLKNFCHCVALLFTNFSVLNEGMEQSLINLEKYNFALDKTWRKPGEFFSQKLLRTL